MALQRTRCTGEERYRAPVRMTISKRLMALIVASFVSAFGCGDDSSPTEPGPRTTTASVMIQIPAKSEGWDGVAVYTGDRLLGRFRSGLIHFTIEQGEHLLRLCSPSGRDFLTIRVNAGTAVAYRQTVCPEQPPGCG